MSHKHLIIQIQSPEEWAELGTQVFRCKLKGVDGITKGIGCKPAADSLIWFTDVFCFSNTVGFVVV